MRRIKHILIMVAMLLCSISMSAHDFEMGGIYYNITSSTDLTVAVTYRGSSYDSYSNEYSGVVTIPSTVTYNNNIYSVTSIGNYALHNCSSLTAITIPEGVTSIGSSAFRSCSSLTSITIPEGVTSIGNYAFKYCNALKKVIIEDGNTTLSLGYDYYSGSSSTGHGLFDDCPLEEVYLGRNLSYSSGCSYGYSPFYNSNRFPTISLGNNVTSIPSYLFYNNSSLTSITLPEGVTSIGERAFEGCSSLTSINIPEGVTSIGDWTFYNCSSLTSITLPEGVTSIGSYAFRSCSGLTSINIPKSVTSIGNGAFSECSSLTSITLPEGVTSIGSYAFSGCTSLTSITLPEGVTSIGNDAFDGCRSLSKVINYSNLSLTKGSGSNGSVALYAKVIYKGSQLTTVGDFQFYTSDGIHSLVNYIGNETDIVLPDSYNGENYKIGDCAFYYCSSQTSITLHEGVTSIGERAFYGCSSLASITIPEDVTSIGNYAFDNCTALKKVIIEDGSSTLSLGYNNYSSATGQGLFYDCPLEEVYLGRNLSYNSGSSYGYSPFYNKDALINVVIGNEVTQIRELAFYSCDNIHSLTISSGVLSIGNSAFSTPVKVIWLTNTPPTGYANAQGSINYAANDQHSSLSNLRVYPYLSSIFEVDGVKYVPVSPAERTCDAIDCAYDSKTTTINVSETASFKGIAMTVKEVMPCTFYGNKHIKEVNISHKGNIGDYAFYDCDGIKSLDISNVGYVGDEAFRGCDALETAIVANSPKEADSTTPQPITFTDWTSINHSNSSTSSETYTFTAAASATLSFDWWVSSEASYDKLIVTLDGVTILEKSGSLSGTYNQAITQGEHTLVVYYTKDGSDSSGSDQASVSNIVVSAGSGGTTGFDGAVCNSVFYDCVSLKSVTLGDKVTSLGDDAFRGCTSLQEIVIPDSVKSVGQYCFSGCTAMTNVTLGRSVATIYNYAFQNCSSLPEITLPQAVTKVGYYVFQGCSKLADVVIADRTEPLALGSNGSSALFADCPLDSIYIGGKITYSTSSSKGYSPFYRNTSLRTIVITDSEEQIYENEFYGCTNLQNVTIGNGVKSIGNYAFSGCSSLEGFSFGSSMETIGEEAFSDCTSLTSITSHAAVPPTCGTQALDDINKWECILSVPMGNADAYYAADQWKEFFFIEGMVEVDHYVLTYVVDGEVVHTEVLKHKDPVTMLAEPTKVGCEFSGWDKTLTTMPAEDVTISGTFTRVNVTHITITVNQYGSGTYCSEYALDFSEVEGLKAYAATGYDSGTGVVTLTRVMTAKAGEGLFIKGEPGKYQVPVLENTNYNTLNMLVGTLVKTPVNKTSDDGKYRNFRYTTKTGVPTPMFYEIADGYTLSANRAYLQIPTAWLPAETKSIALRFEEGEGATDIDPSTLNPQLSTEVYDLQGRRVAQPVKGSMYIVNGRKVVY